jgi:hypothetical protein
MSLLIAANLTPKPTLTRNRLIYHVQAVLDADYLKKIPKLVLKLSSQKCIFDVLSLNLRLGNCAKYVNDRFM